MSLDECVIQNNVREEQDTKVSLNYLFYEDRLKMLFQCLPEFDDKDTYFDNDKDISLEIEASLINKKWKRPSNNYLSLNQEKVVVCHDMMNGYIKDNYYSMNMSLRSPDSFRFHHFMNSDIFIYFSHHSITIPPYSYIKVCHSLGIKILGTVILEWSYQFIEDLANDAEKGEIIDKLVYLCQKKGFDGYLLNFELSSTRVKDLIAWVSLLYQRLKEKNEEYILIWYDSMNDQGFISY